MTAAEAGSPAHPPTGPLDELVDGGDPYACTDCAAAGESCVFHAGWAAGWDACAAFMARAVEDEQAGELAVELGDVEGVR